MVLINLRYYAVGLIFVTFRRVLHLSAVTTKARQISILFHWFNLKTDSQPILITMENVK